MKHKSVEHINWFIDALVAKGSSEEILQFETETLDMSRYVIDMLNKHADEVKRAKSLNLTENHDRVWENDITAQKKWKNSTRKYLS